MRAILIDDEPLALELLENKINSISNIEIVEKFVHFDIEENMNIINNIDIAFLDIEMPGMNGLQLAEILLEYNPNLSIVSITAFNEYAVQAFELHAIDYVLKPIQTNRLKVTLQRIQTALTRKKQSKLKQNQLLNVQVCHNLGFSTNNHEVHPVQWRTTKAKEIFLYLLQHHGTTVRKSNLIEMFWDGVNMDRAFSLLYTNVYHIRKSLSAFHDHFVLRSLNEGYVLDLHNVTIDIVVWENKVKKLPSLNSDTSTLWEEVMALYTGHYLAELHPSWAYAEQFRLEQLWLKTVFHMVQFYIHSHDLEKAEKWLLIICKLKPEQEEAHFQLMKIYERLGFGLLIHHQYNQLKEISRDSNIKISQEIIDWYNFRNT